MPAGGGGGQGMCIPGRGWGIFNPPCFYSSATHIPQARKTFFLNNDVFSIELDLTTGAVEPEGGKSNVLYQNPASTRF